MSTRLAVAAAEKASKDPRLGAFDPTILLNILNIFFPGLGSLFASCFGPKPTPAEVKEELTNAWDDGAQAYHRSVLRPATRQAKRAARKAGKTHCTNDEAEAIAIHGFNQIIWADDVDVQEQLDDKATNSAIHQARVFHGVKNDELD